MKPRHRWPHDEVWRTKEGLTVKVGEMEGAHLWYAFRMAVQRAIQFGYPSLNDARLLALWAERTLRRAKWINGGSQSCGWPFWGRDVQNLPCRVRRDLWRTTRPIYITKDDAPFGRDRGRVITARTGLSAAPRGLPPLVWETMTLHGPMDGETTFSATEEQADLMHAEHLQRLALLQTQSLAAEVGPLVGGAPTVTVVPAGVGAFSNAVEAAAIAVDAAIMAAPKPRRTRAKKPASVNPVLAEPVMVIGDRVIDLTPPKKRRSRGT